MELKAIFAFLWDLKTVWGWVFLPFLLYRPFLNMWLWWRWEAFGSKQKYIMLEVRAPPEVEKPLKAMEDVFSGLWQIYDPPNPREKWFDGKYQLNFAIEIVSHEGEVHFYLYIPEPARKLVEAAIYSQYPDAELSVTDDYTKSFPPDIPNRDWEMWGCNYKLEKPDVYPIKTYTKFFEETVQMEEISRIDPMSLLVEGLSKVGKGEHVWVQLALWPITPLQDDYVSRGRKIVDKLIRRQEPSKPATLWHDIGVAGTTLATGNAPVPVEKKEELIPPEMKLTPGEREIVSSIEQKIGKFSFETSIRFIYLARRDKYFGATKALPMSYFTQFSTMNLNTFVPLRPTVTKVYTVLFWFLDRRRAFIRKRRLYRNYRFRLRPFFPRSGGTFVMNIEELATMFHFSGRITTPSLAVPRVQAKKGEAPPGLPIG